MTTDPVFMTLPTVSLALTSGVRSGRFALSIGVGTVTMKTPQSAISSRLVAEGKVLRCNQILGRDFQRAVLAGLQFGDTRQINIKSHHRPRLAEFDRQRQTNVAQADDRNFLVTSNQNNLFVISQTFLFYQLPPPSPQKNRDLQKTNRPSINSLCQNINYEVLLL